MTSIRLIVAVLTAACLVYARSFAGPRGRSVVQDRGVSEAGGWLRQRSGLALGLATAALLAGGPAHALSLSLAPTAVTQAQGVDFSLALSVGGFGETGTARLQAFTVKLSYDPALLQFVGGTFGTELGVSPTTALESATAASGVVTLTENSLLSAATLESTQPAAFTLATLTFQGLTPGAGAVSLFTDKFTQLVLTNLSLAPFDPPLPTTTTTITPEPAAGLLLVTGLLWLAARRKRA